MLSNTLKTAWKERIEPNNFFDDNFLNEKDIALQPMEFLFESQKENQLNNTKERKYSLNKINEEKSRKTSLKESDIYDSNIIIIQNASDDESDLSTLNQFEKQVEKIHKIILKKQLKKLQRMYSKSKK